MERGRWTFGSFELDAASFQLFEDSRPVKIERIPLELLFLLVERPGQLVSRQEIVSRLWSNSVHVDADSGVHTAMRKLRAALKDSAEQPTFVETVPGKGYRFIGRLAQPATIAVLPFENLSDDREQQYFSDGLTEEIIAVLGAIAPSSVRVIARTSSMAYRRTPKTADEIGRELGASHLVEGTVRRNQQFLRISAKLIRARDHVQVWVDCYDRPSSDLLAVQQEIGAAIARHVDVEVSSVASGSSRAARQDPDAHDMYLRGRYYWHRRTLESLAKAEACFQAAIQKDPSSALAYAGLADTYVLQVLITGANAIEHWSKAQRAIDQALGLNPMLAEPHSAAAMIDFFIAWNWTAAEQSFVRALELNPNCTTARLYYAHLLSNSSRHDEAVAEITRAREIDPLSPVMHTFASLFLAAAGRRDEAVVAAKHALAIDPDFFPVHSLLGHLHDLSGETEAALDEYRTAYRLSGGNLMQLGFQGFELGRLGRHVDAQQISATLHQIAQSRFVPPCAFALVSAGLGDRDSTFAWLDRACELRDVFLVFLPCGKWWEAVRGDPRFAALLRRCRFA